MWRITRYHVDETGTSYGEPFTSDCYTEELMESYKNSRLRSVVKIEQFIGGKWTTIWTK